MAIYGTCKVCEGETRNYACVKCELGENEKLRERVRELKASLEDVLDIAAYATDCGNGEMAWQSPLMQERIIKARRLLEKSK